MSERKLKVIFLICGVILYSLITFLIWPNRFYYDDEWINLRIISTYSFSELISYISAFDFHPPLQYLLNKFIYTLLGPDELLMSVPAILCTGLSVGIAGIIMYEITASKSFSFLTILLSAVHPSVQMWGWSIRWYPVWSFLIIVSFYSCFKIMRQPNNNNFHSFIAALSLIAASYTNYQTLLVLSALVLTFFATDLFGKRINRNNLFYSNTSKIVLITIAVIVFFLPWLFVFDYHLSNYSVQKDLFRDFINPGSIILASGFVFTAFFGPSVYPWDPVFIFLFGVFAILVMTAGYLLFKTKKKSLLKENQDFTFILIFSAVLTILFLSEGLFFHSAENKGVIVISILTEILIIYLIFFIYKKNVINKKLYAKKIVISSLVVFILISIYGTINIIRKEHFHKMGLSDPIPEIVKMLSMKTGNDSGQKLIITINPVLTNYLLWKGDNRNTILLSPYIEDVPGFIFNIDNKYTDSLLYRIKEAELIFVESYIGSLIPKKDEYKKLSDYIRNSGREVSSPVFFGEDPDLHFKREMFPDAELQKFRFKVSFFKPNGDWNIFKINNIIKELSSRQYSKL